MLRVLNRPKADNIEDEAESTAAFFQNTPGRRALKQIAEVYFFGIMNPHVFILFDSLIIF